MSDEARAAIAANPHWYHSIEVAPGVVTPGMVDHRPIERKVLPADLRGRRALDVGTFDGFWAFALERRGAQTVAIDLDELASSHWPPLRRDALLERAREWDVELGRGFRIAAGLLGSEVERVPCDVHDLAPERIGGPVDLVFAGAILLHLRDPVGALERIRETLRPGGELVLLETVSIPLTLRSPRRAAASFQAHRTDFNWWVPNAACVRAWVVAAGFERPRTTGLHRPPARRAMPGTYLALRARRR